MMMPLFIGKFMYLNTKSDFHVLNNVIVLIFVGHFNEVSRQGQNGWKSRSLGRISKDPE